MRNNREEHWEHWDSYCIGVEARGEAEETRLTKYLNMEENG